MKKHKYIFEGSYGCVLKPAEKCNKKNIIKKGETIVKIFNNYNNYKKELKNYSIIEKIFSKKKKLITNKLDECKKKINKYNKKAYIKCDETYSGNDNQTIYQIIYEYGGEDLHMCLNNKKISYKKIFFNLINIFETIFILSKKNYIHLDVRPSNILYNIKNNKSKLIDYGFLIKKHDLYKKEYNFIINGVHHNYPPEFTKYNYKVLLNNFIKILNSLIINNKNNNKFTRFKYIMDYLFDNQNKLELKQEINKDKIDIYMLGISLLITLIEYEIENRSKLTDKEFYLIFNFIKKLIDINIKNRYTPIQALNEYKKIIS